MPFKHSPLKPIEISLTTLALSLCLSFFIFAVSFYQISNSIWPQSEHANTTIHMLSAICALCLAHIGFYSAIPRILIKNLMVILPLAIVILSIIFLPFHPLPMRSFLGSVRTGEGIFLWMDIAILTLGMLTLAQFKFYRILLSITALLGFTICYALTITHLYYRQPYTPFFFSDYMAFNLVALFGIGLIYTCRLKKYKKPATLILYGIILFLTYTTGNKAVIIFMGSVPPFVYLCNRFLTGEVLKYKTLFFKTALITLPLLFIAVFLGITFIANQDGFYGSINTGFLRTLSSRSYLLETALSAAIQDPIRFITGNGWGTYEDNIIKFLPLKWLNTTDYTGKQWDGLTSDHFHVHNMYMETFSTLGLFGAFIFFIYTLSFYYNAKKDRKSIGFIFSCGFVFWASTWFFFPLNIPFMALAAAYLTASKPISCLKRIKLNKIIFLLILLTLAAILILGASLNHIIALNAFKNETPHRQTPSYICDESEYNDFGIGGLHLSRLLLDRVRRIEHELNKDESDSPMNQEEAREQINIINALFCQAVSYSKQHKASARLDIAILSTRGETLLAFDALLTDAEKAYYKKGWENDLKSWLEKYPTRTDLAAPYLLHNIIHEEEDKSLKILNYIYNHNPQDPIGLWFKGLILLKSEATTPQGLAMMKMALNNGVERFMPVDQDLLKILKSR